MSHSQEETKIDLVNAVKAILPEIWFEHNQLTFQNKASSWTT